MAFSNKDIIRYYDLTEFHYRLHWNLDQSRSLHYGYWDRSTKNFHEALLNINRVLASKVDITPADHVLDAGCGIGGSSLWLAKNIGCKVTGIALNSKQLETGKKISSQENLNNLVSFCEADFTNTGFESSSFNVVWAIESVCHARDKSAFIKEAFRLLKPGGRLILCDYFKKAALSPNESKIINRWINGWAIDDIPVLKEFMEMIREAGFINPGTENATMAILPSSKRMAKAYYIGIIPSKIYNLFHRNVSTHGRNNVEAALYQYKGLKRGLWEYRIISAVKSLERHESSNIQTGLS